MCYTAVAPSKWTIYEATWIFVKTWPSTDVWTPICTRRRTLRQCMNPSLVEYMSGGNVICLILCQDEGHLQNILIKTMSELSFLLVRKLFLQGKTFFLFFHQRQLKYFLCMHSWTPKLPEPWNIPNMTIIKTS